MQTNICLSVLTSVLNQLNIYSLGLSACVCKHSTQLGSCGGFSPFLCQASNKKKLHVSRPLGLWPGLICSSPLAKCGNVLHYFVPLTNKHMYTCILVIPLQEGGRITELALPPCPSMLQGVPQVILNKHEPTHPRSTAITKPLPLCHGAASRVQCQHISQAGS